MIPRSPVDRELLRRAGEAAPDLAWADLDRGRLAHLSRTAGCDLAAAVFYDRLLRDPDQGGFFRSVEGARAPRRVGGRLVIVPAACYREYPRFGGGGELLEREALALGMEAVRIPVHSRGPSSENAPLIREALRRMRPEPTVIVSLSKGSTDLRVAWEEPLPEWIRAWVNLCGLPHGTPEASRLLETSPLLRLAARGVLAWMRTPYRTLDELRPEGPLRLARRMTAPPGVVTVSVVGCPASYHLSRSTRGRHRRLAPLGPNDGSGLLCDAYLPGGWVLPVWGADHYFAVPEAPELIRKVLALLAEQGALDSPAPAMEREPACALR